MDWLWVIKERVRLWIARRSAGIRDVMATATAAGSISGLDPANLALIADVSHWNGTIDLNQMQVDFLWIKAGDGKPIRGNGSDMGDYVDDKLYANVQKAWDKKIPCGLYIYIQPLILPGTSNHGIALHHYQVLKRAIGSLIPGKSFHALALDVEEKGSTGPNMAEIVLTLWKMIADDAALAKLPIYIYTNMATLDLYTNLREQISWKGANYNGKPYLLWMAQWAWKATPRITTTWETLRSKYLNVLVMKVITPGYQTWNQVQVAACFILPGCTVNITDLSFSRYDRVGLWKEMNYTAPGDEPDDPEIPEGIEERVTAVEAGLAALVEWKRKVQEA